MTLATGPQSMVRSPTADEVQAQLALGFLDGLYAVMRAAGSLGVNHPSTAELAENVASAAAELAVPCSLQFLGATAFCNRVLLPVDIERVAQIVQVARALDALGAQELVLDQPLNARTLLQLAQVLAKHGEIAVSSVPGAQWRALVGPVWGDAAKPIDRDVAARVWLARAAGAASQLDRDPETAWPWAQSAGILRRLEQVVLLDSAVALRALELSPQPWQPGRRAVAVALRTMLTLHHIGASAETVRLTGHLALLVAAHGISQEGIRAFDLAAQSALVRANLQPGVDEAVSARHRLRVVGMLRALAQRAGTGSAWPGPLGALLINWDLETRRGGGREENQRTTMDALTDADVDPFLLGGRAWLSALIAALAGTPPGSVVIDATQQLGAVLDASGRSGGGKPMLVSNGQMLQGQLPLLPLLREA